MSRRSPRCEPVPIEVRQTADLLERRWQLSIIYAALTGALRFNEFAEAVAGISPRMLSERLRDLEGAGLVERTVIPSSPPTVEYRLTARGRRLGPLIDERRAGAALAEARGNFAALEGIESPLTRGRSAIFATGTRPAQLVPFSEFLGYAESRTGGGDLLLVSGGHRAMFQIGTSFGSGRLDAWTRLRWFLANHWMALLPVLLLGVLLLAAELRRFFARRMRERLALGASS